MAAKRLRVLVEDGQSDFGENPHPRYRGPPPP